MEEEEEEEPENDAERMLFGCENMPMSCRRLGGRHLVGAHADAGDERGDEDRDLVYVDHVSQYSKTGY